MKNLLLFILLGLISFGCVTQKKCNAKFPPRIEHRDSVVYKDTIIYRDTTIFLTVPGELRIDSVPIPCPPPRADYIPDTAYAETKFAKARAWWKYPYIKLKLEQKDTSVMLTAALKETRHWRALYESLTVIPEPVKYIPKYHKIAAWYMGISLALLFLYIGYRIAKILGLKP